MADTLKLIYINHLIYICYLIIWQFKLIKLTTSATTLKLYQNYRYNNTNWFKFAATGIVTDKSIIIDGKGYSIGIDAKTMGLSTNICNSSGQAKLNINLPRGIHHNIYLQWFKHWKQNYCNWLEEFHILYFFLFLLFFVSDVLLIFFYFSCFLYTICSLHNFNVHFITTKY